MYVLYATPCRFASRILLETFHFISYSSSQQCNGEIMDRQQETADLSFWLDLHRGEWTVIASKADVSLRTIYTIANKDGYKASAKVIRKLKKVQARWN